MFFYGLNKSYIMRKFLFFFVVVVVGLMVMLQYIFCVEVFVVIVLNYDFIGLDDGISWGFIFFVGIYVEDMFVFVEDGILGFNV